MSELRSLFGLSVTTAYVVTKQYGSNMSKNICEAMAVGFGLGATDGDSILVYFQNTGPDASSIAFAEAPYSTIEQSVRDIYDNYYLTSTAPDLHKAILTAVTHAMLFAYNLNTSINLYDFQKLLGNVLGQICATALEGVGYFDSMRDSDNTTVVITPFLNSNVIRPFLRNDYTQTIILLSKAAKNTETPLANYNWYDSAKIFQGPNLQVMRDIENQYYYLSGQLVYQSAIGSLDPCLEDEVTISSWSGDVSFTYVRNPPCRDASSYIGPPNRTLFNRVFNDGPYSSGFFSGHILDFYTGNDKQMLIKNDYLTNAYNLTNYTGLTPLALTLVDANGNYDLLGGDYLNAPNLFGCSVPPVNMHIGGNEPRVICSDAKSCVCTLQNVTGFKFALTYLGDEYEHDMQFRLSNPIPDVSRVLKRALNIDPIPYLATDDGTYLWPYTQDPNPPYTQYWYVGYPQLDGGNTLPNLAFFQSFWSPTFGKNANVCIFPSLAKSVGNETEYADSSRTYSISNSYMYSGEGNLPIQFNTQISSNLSGQDWVAQKFYGMGTAFSGRYDIKVTAEENAGFFYTGFTVIDNGTVINSSTLADAYTGCILGSQRKTMQFISGYTGVNGIAVPLTNFLAKNSTGDVFTYQWFSPLDIPAGLQVPEAGWPWFAAVPSDLENNLKRAYDTQTVENYLPRFYDGPFSVEWRKFLYPNASTYTTKNQGKLFGMPTGISLSIEIREEVVRELYGKYTIYSDGSVSVGAEYEPVIRSDIMSNETQNPVMTRMFHPNQSYYDYYYNFNQWTESFSTSAEIGNMVDSNWAPPIPYKSKSYVPLGRNSNIYSENVNVGSIFWNGVQKRRQTSLQNSIVFTDKQGSYYLAPSENPRADGLYHAFNYTKMDLELAYCLPAFNLISNEIIPQDNWAVAFPETVQYNGRAYYHYRGTAASIDSGRDPMFYEILGGRRGGPTAQQEGGYHSQEMVGDRWFGMSYVQPYGYGWASALCSNDGEHEWEAYWRAPGFDDHLVVFNTAFSGTDIWINGFSWTPFVVNRVRDPLPVSTVVNVYADGLDGPVAITPSGGGAFLNFELSQYFLLKPRTGDANSVEWYYGTGLQIGPFDRDVEVCLSNGETLAALSDFYFNGTQLSHWFYESSNCEQIWAQGVGIGRIVQCSYPQWSYNGRDDTLTILGVIPSGELGTFNIKSELQTDTSVVPANGLARRYLGIPSGVILSLRTHSPLDADDYISNWESGEYGRMKSDSWVNNGLASKLHIDHPDGPQGLGGTYEFVTFSRSGKLYPKPDPTEYAKLATKDEFGNVYYADSVTPEAYWRSYAIKHKQQVYFSGYREGTRLSITFTQNQPAFDKIDYQAYRLVAPSGNCYLSGEMGYYAQADDSIFTEGIYLTNTTVNDVLSGNYNPSYVSDSLRRLTGINLFAWPVSTDATQPVLDAPSRMMSREFQSGISGDQSYYYYHTAPPLNYNKLLWPALSDLETLNPGETMEALAPGDGMTFPNSSMIFSASQGQALPNGTANPYIMKQYTVQSIFQMYDSVATDAVLNSGTCITSGHGTSVTLDQASTLSGALVPQGSPLSLVIQGLV